MTISACPFACPFVGQRIGRRRPKQEHKTSLPNCETLHRDVQVAWEVFGPSITFEIAARIADDEYVAFGLSGSESEARMEDSDVTVVYMVRHDSFILGFIVE